MKKNDKYIYLTGFLLVFIVRIFYLMKTKGVVDGDMAVFGLMAKHISQLKEFPLFMWKAHYSSALSSYIMAFLFNFFGVSGEVIISVMILWEAIGIFLFSMLFPVKVRMFIPFLFIFVPFKLFLNILTPSYGELIFFGMLSFLLMKSIYNSKGKPLHYFLLGLFNGGGITHQPMYLPYLITSVIFSIKNGFFKNDKNRISFEAGFITGILPLFIYNVIHPFATFGRLIGRVSGEFNLRVLTGNFFEYIPPLYFIFFVISFIYLSRCKEKDFIIKLFLYFAVVSFIFYFFPGIQKGRYLLPFYYASIGVMLLASKCLYDKTKYFISSIIVVILVLAVDFYNIVNFKVYDYYNLINYLKREKIFYVYSDYWLAYPLIFHSNEAIIASPRANDSMGFYDRYPEYSEMVRKEKRKTFIFDNRLLNVEKRLIFKLKTMGIDYKRENIGDFTCITFTYNGDDGVFLI